MKKTNSHEKMALLFPHAPDSPEWKQAAYRLALQYAPQIYACKKCLAPVLKGYCCTHCGDNNPRQPYSKEELE